MQLVRFLILAFWLLATPTIAAEGEAVDSEPVPGQLDVVEKTAVALDGRPPEGVPATSFRWRIVEGEDGKLFGEDREDAVFLAPRVERGVKEFVVELTVTYVDEPPSTRQIRIRVLPTDPADAAEEAEGETPQWILDHYQRAAEVEQQKQSAPPTFGGGRSGPSVSIGVAGSSSGHRRGGVGLRWSMSYPISQPVDVPPPGQSRKPGEGTWDRARPVPYEELESTFPESVVDGLEAQDESEPPETNPDED
jgi:hypothetical protein